MRGGDTQQPHKLYNSLPKMEPKMYIILNISDKNYKQKTKAG
jgi:hypothetical protein